VALAVCVGDVVGGWPRYPAVAAGQVALSTFRCNLAAVAIMCGCYFAKEARPQLARNVLFVKMISAFCGALSCFGVVTEQLRGLLSGSHYRAAVVRALSLSLSLSLFLVVLSAPAYVYARAGGSWFDCSLSHTYIHQPANLQVHVGLNGGAALAATSLLLAHHRRYRVLETAATRIAAQFRACVTRRRSSSRIRRGPTV
jgi:hypothetical protein